MTGYKDTFLPSSGPSFPWLSWDSNPQPWLYCINVCLIRSCSVSINSCKSDSVKLLPEATLKVTNGQNSCTGWATACIKHQVK